MPSLRPLVLPILASAWLVACSGSTKPPESPDTPASSGEPDAKSDAPAAGDRDKKDDATPPPSRPQDDNSVPDDYSITAGDCDALGEQYGHAAKADQMATISPKVSEKQRAAAEAAIDKVVGKLSQTWSDHCRSALVGKVADPKALKCAIAAPTVKAFDVCLNGENTTSDKPQRGGKKK